MAFSGDFTPLSHKHTKNLELRDSISIAVDRIHRGFEPLKQKVQAMREQVLTEDEVKLIIYQAFLGKNIKGIPKHLMSVVHDHYFHPHHEAFIPRNLWSLSNAFTSSFKKLAPVKQFEITARLGSYLSDVQETLNQKQELFLPIRKEEDLWRFNPNPQAKDLGYESFDEDDIAEDPFEDFEDYFDEEAESEVIDEATEQLVEEFERRLAA